MRKPPDGLPGFQQYQFAFTRHIRNPAQNPRPAGVEPRRMAIYNDLLYNNVESFLLRCFPVCRKILGESEWNALARDFFANHRSGAPLFRQIPEEFVRFTESRGDHPDQPPLFPAFLPYLAHYEWVELALDVSPLAADMTRIDAEGDLLLGAPALNPVLLLLHYPYAVHRVGEGYQPTPEQQETTWLLAFRNLDDKVRFIALNPVAARLIALIQDEPPGEQAKRQTGKAILEKISAELQHPDPAVVRAGGVEIMQNLREQQALLGVWI